MECCSPSITGLEEARSGPPRPRAREARRTSRVARRRRPTDGGRVSNCWREGAQRMDTKQSAPARRTSKPVKTAPVPLLSLPDQARRRWAERIRQRRWTWFVRLSWSVEAGPVSPYRAQGDVARWAEKLGAEHPGVAVVAGYHVGPASERLHVHALIYVPRRGAPRGEGEPTILLGVARARWQATWSHGPLWLDAFRPWRAGRDPQGHGAAFYVAEQPSTVEEYGTPPAYRPRRRRAGRPR